MVRRDWSRSCRRGHGPPRRASSATYGACTHATLASRQKTLKPTASVTTGRRARMTASSMSATVHGRDHGREQITAGTSMAGSRSRGPARQGADRGDHLSAGLPLSHALEPLLRRYCG
jgi:hypothetical protein